MSSKLELVQTNLNKMMVAQQDAIPEDFNKTRFMHNCMTVMSETNGIEKANPESVAKTLIKGAFLGLDFFNKECYAISYNGHVSFQTDYKGEVKVTKRFSSKPIKDIYAKLVREGDEYEESISMGLPDVSFKPKAFNDGKIQGAFAVCLFEDGSMKYEAMSTSEIESVRKNYSKQPNGSVWTKSTGEMYKKTVIRRLCKMIDLDFGDHKQDEAYKDGSDADFSKNKPKPAKPNLTKVEIEDAEEIEMGEEDYELLLNTKLSDDCGFTNRVIGAFLKGNILDIKDLCEDTKLFEDSVYCFLKSYLAQNKKAFTDRLGDDSKMLDKLPTTFTEIVVLFNQVLIKSKK